MKKLLAIAIIAVMMLSMAVFAAPTTLDGLMADVTSPSRPAPWVETIDVPVNIMVDAGEGYVDGPVNKENSSSLMVDYQATIYMQAVRERYSHYVDVLERLIYITPEIAPLQTELVNCTIEGGFTIEITYPKATEVPEAILSGSNLDGFSIKDGPVFEEISRDYTDIDDTFGKLTINIKVKDGILAGAMTHNLNTWLPDITLTGTGITLKKPGENKVTGTITGYTKITDSHETEIITINYVGKQGTDSGITGETDIIEIVNLSSMSGEGNPIIPPVNTGVNGPVEVEVKIPSISKTEIITIPKGTKNPTIDVEKIEKDLDPTREGFVFAGFYADEFYTQKLEGKVPVTKDTTIYGRFINVTVPEIFNADEHIQYIYGYPDGTVRPEANVKREEVTAMLYRLLKPEVRAELETSENNFSDVSADKWSIVPISSMAKGGYIYGYSDGTFKPDADITRGELAAMVSRFVGHIVEGERTFNDIDGHWAEASIKSVANNEWIFGYTDGSFKPDEKITRAETVAIINRVVVRYVTHEGLTGDERIWPDNPVSAWYYYPIVEASHHHEHERDESKYNELWNTAISN